MKLPTHYPEFREKSKFLTSYFYSIIAMVRRLPGTWYIIYCVYKESRLNNSASKSGHIYYAEKLQKAV